MAPTSVALFATCLVDLFYPEVGVATVRLLRRLGLRVTYPRGQTCCGQPLYNNGFHEEARRIARHTIALLEPAECVVIPSGSCACMLTQEYLHLFRDDAGMRERAAALGRKTYELSDFLVRVLGREDVGARFAGAATYHASCHLLRGLGITDAPMRLLRNVRGLALRELPAAEHCCGFGGSFSVAFPDVSNAMPAGRSWNVSPEIGTDRAAFLSRLRAALARPDMELLGPETAIVAPSLAGRADRIRGEAADRWEELLSRFTAELEAVAGAVHRAEAAAVPALAARIARERGLFRLVTWNESALGLPGLCAALRAEGLEVMEGPIPADDPATPAGVEGIRGGIARGEIGLTGADFAVAESGSLLLLSGPGRGRLVSSLPMVHVAILRPGRLLGTWEEAGVLLEALHRENPPTDSPSGITFITGPSRTADIGLTLTRGAHGPKEVHVIALT